jgi:hypothetical protein
MASACLSHFGISLFPSFYFSYYTRYINHYISEYRFTILSRPPHIRRGVIYSKQNSLTYLRIHSLTNKMLSFLLIYVLVGGEKKLEEQLCL